MGAFLKGAFSKGANLKGAFLKGANLKGAFLQHNQSVGVTSTELKKHTFQLNLGQIWPSTDLCAWWGTNFTISD